MKRSLFIPVIASLLLAGCVGRGNNKESASPVSDTLSSRHITADGRILAKLNERSEAEIKDSISGIGAHRTFIIEAQKGQTLKASVKPDSLPANIRINQIVSPSGKMDGPFGRDMEYELNEAGQWKIIVGESNMQGDDYKGRFTLYVKLGKASPVQEK